MAIIPVNGLALKVRCDGDRRRPAVVLSHSLGTNLSMWDAQAALLATRFYVVRYDTRGHGASVGTSGAPPGPYTIAQLGGDVLALLDHVDIDRAHFVGLSLGGVSGQWLGAQARAAAVRAGGMNEIAVGAPARWFTPAFVARQPVVVGTMQKTLPASHLSNVEAPDRFSAAAASFLLA
jgi:3-oxoadipate enol-lactonase